MREKPALPDEVICACLRERYGLAVTGLEFLPLGNDSVAWSYRVQSSSGTFFLKIKSLRPGAALLSIPHFLREQGLQQVVAPLTTTTGKLFQAAQGFFLILYPYIAGLDGMQAGLTAHQRRELGRVVKQIHSTLLPEELAARLHRETFSPYWAPQIRQMRKLLGQGELHTPEAEELAAFWQEKETLIEHIVWRARFLGAQLRRARPEFVLCHADIHDANLLIDPSGALFIVDWDEIILAPKERDLTFLTDTAGETSAIRDYEARLFFDGYGETVIDPLALRYYKYEWCVQEIGDFAARILLRDDFGAETRRESLAGFIQLFHPDDVIAIALRTDAP